jgi:hypothetical protein
MIYKYKARVPQLQSYQVNIQNTGWELEFQ